MTFMGKFARRLGGFGRHEDGAIAVQFAFLALPVAVAGLLVAGALVLLWRAFCEFYVAIFRIRADLRALRQQNDAERVTARSRAPGAQ